MISRKEVKHIAQLAKIPLREKEVGQFQRELGEILDFVRLLEEVDLKGVEPIFQVTGLENVFRRDEVKPSFKQSQALSGAVKKHRGYFQTQSLF